MKEKEKKKGNWRFMRPEWATAHFESSITTEKVCRDRVPLALCRDRACWPDTQADLGVRNKPPSAVGTRARQHSMSAQ